MENKVEIEAIENGFIVKYQRYREGFPTMLVKWYCPDPKAVLAKMEELMKVEAS